MITEDDVSKLRADGLSDSDILDKFKQFSPGDAEGISKLTQEGMSPKDVLGKLVEYHKPAPKSWGQTAMELLQAPVYGLGQDLKDIGKTNDVLGVPGVTDTSVPGSVGEGLQQTLAPGYQPSQFNWRHPLDTAGELPKAVAEGLPALAEAGAAGAAGAAAGGAVGGGIGALFGGIGAVPGAAVGSAIGSVGSIASLFAYKALGKLAEQRAENNNHASVTPQDIKEAIPGALAIGAINAAGLKGGGALTPATGGVINTAKALAKTGAVNAGAGAASDVADQLGATVGTDKGASVDPDRVINAGVVSAAQTAAHKGLLTGREALADLQFRKADEGNARLLAADLANAHGKTAEERLRNVKSNVLDNLSGTFGTAGDEAINAARNGTVIDNQRLSALGQDPAFVANPGAFESLQKLNEINRLNSRGLSAERTLEQHTPFLDKANGLSATMSLVKKGIPWAITAGALSHNPLYALGPIAAPFILKGLARGADNVTGRADPVQRFQDKFAPLPQAPVSPQAAAIARALQFAKAPQQQQQAPGAQPTVVPRGPNPVPAPNMALAQAAMANHPNANAPVAPPPSTPAPPAGPAVPQTGQVVPQGLRTGDHVEVSANDPIHIDARDPAQRAALLQQILANPDALKAPGTAPKPAKGKAQAQQAQDMAAALAKASSAKAKAVAQSAPQPEAPHITPIDLGETVRMQPTAEIRNSPETIQTGGKVKIGVRKSAYDTPVEGLDAASRSMWESLTKPPTSSTSKDGGALREEFNSSGLAGPHGQVARSHMLKRLKEHGFNEHSQKKIMAHLDKHSYFKTYHSTSKALKKLKHKR